MTAPGRLEEAAAQSRTRPSKRARRWANRAPTNYVRMQTPSGPKEPGGESGPAASRHTMGAPERGDTERETMMRAQADGENLRETQAGAPPDTRGEAVEMGERIVYEIVNPSDACTIVATDPMVATLACLVLGGGHYALNPDPGCPMFFKADVDQWAIKEHGDSFHALLERYADEVAACLESFLYGSEAARSDYESAIEAIESEEGRRQFRESWFDRRRTSMNNIGARAESLAESFREQEKGHADA